MRLARRPMQLQSLPVVEHSETAVCPVCERQSPATGRIGLRLVFECGRCRVVFFRSNQLSWR